jgi:hypothetical protein
VIIDGDDGGEAGVGGYMYKKVSILLIGHVDRSIPGSVLVYRLR